MAIPAIPAQGAPWLSYAQGLDDEIRTGRLSDTELRAAYGSAAVANSGLVSRPLGRGLLDFWADQAFLTPPAYDTPTFSDTASTSGATTGSLASATLIREKRVGDVAGNPLDMAGDTHFRYSGTPTGVAQASNFPLLFVETENMPGGAATFKRWPWAISTETNAAAIAFKLRTASSATGINYRLQVNGRWVTEDSVTVAETGGTTREFKFTFPDARPRLVTLHLFDQTAFGGVWVTAGQTAIRPPSTPQRRIAVIGDSLTAGAVGVGTGDTFAPRLAYLLGSDSTILGGIGGTRWTAPGGTGDASLAHFRGRLPTVLGMNPDVIVFAGSRNDPTSDLAALQNIVRDTVADCAAVPEVYVTGTVTNLAQNAAVKAGALAAGRPFIDVAGTIYGTGNTAATTGDGNADHYISSDGIHPTLTGHKFLARRLFQGIQHAYSMS